MSGVQNRDDKRLSNCDLCNTKRVTMTICCNKKLCEWHVQNDGEYADQGYCSCHVCETYPIIGNGYSIQYNTVYCEEHNIMQFCEKCDRYVCEKHQMHECIEWVEVPSPKITDEQREEFIKKHCYQP